MPSKSVPIPHQFPKPMWNAGPEPARLPAEIAVKYPQIQEIEPGGIFYVPNQQVLVEINEQRQIGTHMPQWTDKPVGRDYPRAMHGPNGQSVTVRNKKEMDAAIKVGWSLKPLVKETPAEMPPSPFRSPLGLETVETK